MFWVNFKNFSLWLSDSQNPVCGPHRLTEVVSMWVKRFYSFLKLKDVSQSITCAYKPQKNVVVERINCMILSAARALLKQKSVPKVFWACAVATAVFICNRFTGAGTWIHATSFELWTVKKPDSSLLHVFGSPCWYHIRREQYLKLRERGSLAVMIGYAAIQKVYKL